jgi:hypothetical protein
MIELGLRIFYTLKNGPICYLFNERGIAMSSPNPARKMKPSGVKNICMFQSTKTVPEKVVRIRVESILEKDFCYYLDFSKKVVRYKPQPQTFTFIDPKTGELLRYTPDFWVKYQSGFTEYVEVKPRVINLAEDYQRKLDTFANMLNRHGEGFRVVGRESIQQSPRLTNYQFLHRYSIERRNPSDTIRRLASEFPTGARLRQMVSILPTNKDLKNCYYAIAKGALVFDMGRVKIQNNPRVTYANRII